MMKYEIVPLEQKYCAKVAELAKNNLPERLSYDALCDVLNYDYNFFYVACSMSETAVIGFAGMMIIDEEAELLYIAVDERYRRFGVGQSLLNKVLEKAGSLGGKRMLLEVRKGNIGAIKFYQKNQFKKISERKNYYKNPTEDAIIMDVLI